MFVIRKYVKAKSASDAIKKERKMPVDEVWVDDDWKKENATKLGDALGFIKEDSEQN